jgi:hypothetical protein
MLMEANKPKKGCGPLVIVLGIVGVFVVLVCGVLGGLALLGSTVEVAEEASPRIEAEASAAGGANTTDNIPAGWQEVVWEDGDFAVLMPGEPQGTERTLGGIFDATFVQFTNRDGAYQVLYYDIPDTTLTHFTTDEILREAVDSGLAHVGAVLVSEHDISLDGHPGREVTGEFALNGADALYHGRYFVADSRFYQVYVVGDADALQQEDSDTFLNSFTLLGSGE